VPVNFEEFFTKKKTFILERELTLYRTELLNKPIIGNTIYAPNGVTIVV